MAKKTSIPLLAEFHAWASKSITSGTANNYCGWLQGIPTDIGIPNSNFLCDYLNIIGSYIKNGERIYALSVLDAMCDVFNNFSGSITKTKYSNDQSALRKYKEFITAGIDYSKPFVECAGFYPQNHPTLKQFVKGLTKTNCATIDSMNGLIHEIGVNKFIKMAIEQSLFFSKDIVDKQFSIISSKNEPKDSGFLYARASTSTSTYSNKKFTQYYQKEFDIEGYSCDVILDGTIPGGGGRKYNENFHVSSKINNYTGYTIIGNHSILKNYIISHIWGQASDPRYYTSFWNIVLVPAWANFLLDKNPPMNSLASKFKATMMSVCENYFAMNSMNWSSLMMNKPTNILPADILHGTYCLQIINEKSGSQKFGNITNDSITIS